MVKIAASLLLAGVLADAQTKYNEWQAVYGTGQNSADEFQTFQRNLRLIEDTQANDDSAVYSHMGPFAATSPEDFNVRLGYRAMAGTTPGPLLDVSSVADSYDWREHGAVNAIKDQGQCGSCWAFSTVANVEGVGQVETGKLLSLSEQQLMDCDTSDGSCQGGLPSNAFQYMIDNSMGLEGESAYPYKAADGTCSKVSSQEKAFITAWHQISSDETQIAAAVQQYGPLSIGINANTFQNYQSGVANPTFCNPRALDHGVAIVGFGTDSGKAYWTIRNSWGSSWGEKGYIRMVRGSGKCGLNTDVTTATGVSTQLLTAPEPTPALEADLTVAVDANLTVDVDANAWLTAHNKYRCMHGVPSLSWSSAVAKKAQDWANAGVYKHSDAYHLAPPAGPSGENIALGYGSAAAAIKGWYDEVSACSGHFPGCEHASKTVGHFTAMTWKGVRELGCGQGTAQGRPFYVCHYKAGNSLNCDTPNMQGCYSANVLAPSKSASRCGGATDVVV